MITTADTVNSLFRQIDVFIDVIINNYKNNTNEIYTFYSDLNLGPVIFLHIEKKGDFYQIFIDNFIRYSIQPNKDIITCLFNAIDFLLISCGINT